MTDGDLFYKAVELRISEYKTLKVLGCDVKADSKLSGLRKLVKSFTNKGLISVQDSIRTTEYIEREIWPR